MRRTGRLALAVVALAVIVGASVVLARGWQARDALSDARRHVLEADHLVVTHGRRQVLYSDARTVIKRGDRVVTWESRRESFTLHEGSCCERHTEWNRADARDMRDSDAFPDLGEPRFAQGSDGRQLVGREDSFDGPTVMWTLRLDSRGRPVTLRRRAGYDNVGYSGWSTARYEFLSRSEFNRRGGAKPRMSCPRRG